MRLLVLAAAFALAASSALAAAPCPPGKIACAAWCKKYRPDAAGYEKCMVTHPTESCRVLGANYCARDRWHS